jgi:hypothetical protein
VSERKKQTEAERVARRIRIAMHVRGMNSADIVRKTRLGSGQISNYLNGWMCMQTPALLQICNALHCSADFLLGLSDKIAPRGLRFEEEQ